MSLHLRLAVAALVVPSMLGVTAASTASAQSEDPTSQDCTEGNCPSTDPATPTATAVPTESPETEEPAGQECLDENRTETGVCVPAVEVLPLTEAQEVEAVEKVEDRLNAEVALSQGEAPVNKDHSDVPQFGPIDDGVYAYTLPEVVNMTIWKEGQGNGKKSYTCGPSATRNIVNAMNKRASGSYNDLGENQWAIWQGTTTAGTSRANIAASLNAHASRHGSFSTFRPASEDGLISTIATNTYYQHQSVILNVDTEYFNYFNGKALDHFNFAYGFDAKKSTKRIAVGEEWDPIYIYGSSAYGNPYGKHGGVPLSNVYQAVMHTGIHGIVA